MTTPDDPQLRQVLHDILSPLSVLKVLSLTGDEKLGSVERQRLIGEAVRRIEGIAHTLFSGHRVLSKPVPLNRCVRTLMSEKRIQYPRVRLHLKLDRRSSRIGVPEMEIKRLLSNLINNAVEAGASTIRVRVAFLRGSWSLTVADDGEGLPPHALEKFERGEFHSCGGKAGLGLGLAHMQRVLQTLNGKLKLKSAPGQGATFTLKIPA